MKAILLIFSVLISPAVLADSSIQTPAVPVTCESLTEKVQKDCDFLMCQDIILDGLECVKDGDFFEGYSICVYDNFFNELELYNDANPNDQLVCEDEE